MVVFDRAYNYYRQFALWTQKNVFFVTRIKKNTVYTVVEVLDDERMENIIEIKKVTVCDLTLAII